MALPHCIKCGGFKFELADSHLREKGPRVVFVQCSACGGVVGALELHAAEKWLEERSRETTPLHDQQQIEL